jgi:hypothetical protein
MTIKPLGSGALIVGDWFIHSMLATPDGSLGD